MDGQAMSGPANGDPRAAGCDGAGPGEDATAAVAAGGSQTADTVRLVGSLLDVIAVMQWRIEQLEAALERRAVIEQAKGALMAREGVDADAAFLRLRQAARSTRQPIRQVASEVLAGGALPPVDGWR
jgi:hypothetical protein